MVYAVCCLVPVHAVLWTARGLGSEPESLQALKLPLSILPTLTAFVLTYLLSGEKGVIGMARRTFLKTTGVRVYFLGLLVFPALAGLALIVRTLHDGYFPPSYEWKAWYLVLLASPFLLIIPGILEEYGWRGFMQERLQNTTNVFAASFIVGLTWGAWHMMDFLMGRWLFEPYVVIVFFVYITAVSLIVGLFYKWSGGSVFVAMLVHFSANIVNFFIPIWLLEPGLLTPLIFIALTWLLTMILFLGSIFGKAKTGEADA